MKKIFVINIVLIFIFVFLTDSCHKKEVIRSANRIISVSILSAFNDSYDPSGNAVISLNPFYDNVYTKLFKYDKLLQPQSSLVEKCQVDGKKVTFTIKKSGFSNGMPITTRDIRWTIENLLKKTPQVEPWIIGTADFLANNTDHLSGFKDISPRSFSLELIKENDYFKHRLASAVYSILPSGYTTESPVYSGAYELTLKNEEENRTVLRLTKNPYYYQEINIPEIDLCFYKGDDSFKSSVQNREHDLILYFGFQHTRLLSQNYSVFRVPMAGKFFIILNAARGFFKDRENRKSFKDFLDGLNLREDPRFSGHSPPRNVLPYGLRGGMVFKPLKRETSRIDPGVIKKKLKAMNNPYGIRKPLFELMKKEAEKIGWDLNLSWNNYDEWNEQYLKGGYDITSLYYLASIPLSESFYKQVIFEDGELHPPGFLHEGAKKIFHSLEKETNKIEQLRILWKLEQLLRDESFLIPLFNIQIKCGYKADVIHDFPINSMFETYFADMELKTGY